MNIKQNKDKHTNVSQLPFYLPTLAVSVFYFEPLHSVLVPRPAAALSRWRDTRGSCAALHARIYHNPHKSVAGTLGMHTDSISTTPPASSAHYYYPGSPAAAERPTGIQSNVSIYAHCNVRNIVL